MRLPLLLALALLLIGCGETPVPRGSAQDLAVGAAARADSNALAADQAAVEAARAGAAADALEAAAKALPTDERIRAAVAARVEAASSKAVADALQRQADKAADDAQDLTEAARRERNADLQAAEDRRWVFLCRCVGLAGVGAGALLGGLLTWLSGPKLGLPLGSLIVGTGLLVTAYGATITWLPIALAAVVVVAVIVWAIAHSRSLRVGAELSKTVDALEGNASVTVAEAKESLAKAVGSSGLGKRFTRLRRGWGVAVA
jgi:hypothetical protein